MRCSDEIGGGVGCVDEYGVRDDEDGGDGVLNQHEGEGVDGDGCVYDAGV